MLTSSDTSESTLKQFWKHNGPEKSRFHDISKTETTGKIRYKLWLISIDTERLMVKEKNEPLNVMAVTSVVWLVTEVPSS